MDGEAMLLIVLGSFLAIYIVGGVVYMVLDTLQPLWYVRMKQRRLERLMLSLHVQSETAKDAARNRR